MRPSWIGEEGQGQMWRDELGAHRTVEEPLRDNVCQVWCGLWRQRATYAN